MGGCPIGRKIILVYPPVIPGRVLTRMVAIATGFAIIPSKNRVTDLITGSTGEFRRTY
jgi:hypothetical protein